MGTENPNQGSVLESVTAEPVTAEPVTPESAADLIVRTEMLIERVESLPDAQARQTALDLVRAVVSLYGEGLTRLIASVATEDPASLPNLWAADDLLSHLLLLHGLHPLDPYTRIERALDAMRARRDLPGVVLVEITDTTARLRLPALGGCGSTAKALRTELEQAVLDAAPDIKYVEFDEEPAPPVMIPLTSPHRDVVVSGATEPVR